MPLALFTVFGFLYCAPATAQESRLLDLDPFDLLVLKEDLVELRLQPLKLTERRPVADLAFKPDDTIQVRLLDRPDQQYQVQWQDVHKIVLFEEMLLAEASKLVLAEKFEEAYEYYLALEKRDAGFPGVNAGFATCLFQEAGYWSKQGRLDQSLALLNEVHRRNPAHAGLENALGQIVDRVAETHFQNGAYAAVRSLVDDLTKKFPGHAVVRRRRTQLIDEANKALAAAQTAFQDGRMRQAHQAATTAVGWWPQVEGGDALRKQIHAQYPILAVGVSRLADPANTASFNNWAELRQRRLLHRLLVEPVGYEPENGLRSSPTLVDVAAEEDGVRLTVKDGLTWPSSGQGITSFDIVQQLLQEWSSVAQTIKLDGEQRVAVTLRHPHARVETLLQTPLKPWHAAAGSTAGAGPYRLGVREKGEVNYLLQPHYFAQQPQQIKEIIERRVTSTAGAIRALRSGDIAAFDRIAPWEVTKFSRHAEISVRRYASPTVHLLVPNLAKRHWASGELRRAIVYGINRERILRQELSADPSSPSGEVLSGPFPSGYASNPALKPRGYEPRMLLAIPAKPPTLVLAYPASATARRACLAIQQQLSLEGNGLSIELQEMEPGQAKPASDDWDLLYVEWTTMEPLVDASRLLGSNGLAGGGGPWLDVALNKLATAADMTEAKTHLHQIHQTVRDNAVVIPLWQLNEHFAIRKLLTGVESDPVTLFQTVESWRNPN